MSERCGLVILTQAGLGTQVKIVGMVSRSLTPYEQGRPPLEQKLHMARWALHKCRRFTTSAPKVTIFMEEPEGVMVLNDKTHHLKIEAILIDLASYRAVFKVGGGDQYQWVEALLLGQEPKGLLEQPGGEQPPITLPTFEHHTHAISYPSQTSSLPRQITDQPHVTAFFDGGAAQKLGTGGFIVFGMSGECLVARALFYGEEITTNNKAEARALLDLMKWLAAE